MKQKRVERVRAPLATLKDTRVSGVNTEKVKKTGAQEMAHLAHFDSDGIASGGTITDDEMMHISINTTGKRWYVSYYIHLPSGERKRKRAYGRVNAEKNLEIRKQKLLQLQQEIFNLLLQNKDPLEKSMPGSIITIYKCVDVLIRDKQPYLKTNSMKTIKFHLNVFKKWLLLNNNEHKHPAELKRQDMIDYRNWLLNKKLANRSVNNAMREVSDLYNYIIDNNDFIFKSPLYKLKKLPSRSEKHVQYKTDVFQKMFDYMKLNDPELSFYLKLITFAYLRTDEAQFLKIKDIDLPRRKINLTADANKTNKRTFKIIQEIIVDEFEKRQLHLYNEDYFLFSKGNEPGPTCRGENYFRKRFLKVKKLFGLTKLHTIYGFRHTSVTQILEAGTEWHKAMDLTGHEDMASFQQYVRNLLGRDPEDHSHAYKVKL